MKMTMSTLLQYVCGRIEGSCNHIVRRDIELSGKVDVQQFRGAMGKLGCALTESEARQVIRHFHRDDTTSSSLPSHTHPHKLVYEDFIRVVSSGDAHFLQQPTARHVANSLSVTPTARAPAEATQALNEIRRSVESFCSKSNASVKPRDLLHGTFLRFDTNRNGHLTQAQLKSVLRELRCQVADQQIAVLVHWMDSDGSETFDYRLCVTQLYGNPDFRPTTAEAALPGIKIGRASCRERVL